MGEQSSQGVIERLVQRLGRETRLSSLPERSPSAGWGEQRFKARPFNAFMKREGNVLVVVIVAVGLFALGMLVAFVVTSALMSGAEPTAWPGLGLLFGIAAFAIMLVVGVSVGRLASGYLLDRKGEVRLAHDRLIESGLFDHVREFTYDQVYEIRVVGPERQKSPFFRRRRGPRIRYYTCGEDGRLEYYRIRQARLIVVRGSEHMVRELGQRIAAPQPDPETERAITLRGVLLPVALQICGVITMIAAAIAAVWPLPAWFRNLLVLCLVVLSAAAWIALGALRWAESRYGGGRAAPAD